ncbi:CPBP family intramembrane glutamic endopeptidase [Patescibacteria group bacterium]
MPTKTIKFLLITFALTWACWLPGLLFSIYSFNILKSIYIPFIIVGTFVPSTVGIIFLKKSKQNIKKRLNFKIGKWWIPIILIFPIGGLLAQLAHTIINGSDFTSPSNIILLPIQFLMILVLMGPLGEEFGWRGYLLPQIQKKYNAFISSIIVGLIWVFWHIPLFFIEGAPQSKLPFIQFSITLIISSILITWIQNNTKQNLWPALIIHTMINFTNEIFQLIDITNNNYIPWIYANIILCVFTFIIILRNKTEILTKKEIYS